MKKIDYLKLSLQNSIHRTVAWVFSVFTLTKTNENPNDITYLRLMRTDTGYSFFNSEAKLEVIEDADKDQPLFKFLDRVNIDNTWAINVTEPLETSIGNILFNAWSIVPSFGKKFPFPTGKISIDKIEKQIAPKCLSTPTTESERSDQYYYIDEYLKMIETLQFIESFSSISIISATQKNMTPPKGIKEYKEKLMKEYSGRLTDPVILAEFESKLMAFDKEYLKDDESLGKFTTGKILHTARKKMFLNHGAEPGFTEKTKVNPIITSLDEGWPTDPVLYTEMMNGLRSGSYFRGAETVNGGVAAKILLRASNNFKIEDRDCGATLGISRSYNENNVDTLVGRYILQGSKTLFIENKTIANNYLNQELKVRTPMYCKLEGDKICKVCAGQRLSQFKDGMAIPLTNISFILLYAAMKKMHNSALTTAKLDLHSYLN